MGLLLPINLSVLQTEIPLPKKRGRKRRCDNPVSPVQKKFCYTFDMLEESEDDTFYYLTTIGKIQRVCNRLIQDSFKLPDALAYKNKIQTLAKNAKKINLKYKSLSSKSKNLAPVVHDLVKLSFDIFVDLLLIDDENTSSSF